jgi:hypothetical protein
MSRLAGLVSLLLIAMPVPDRLSSEPAGTEEDSLGRVTRQGNGPLSVRLEGVDVEDVFAVLARETSGPSFNDASVRGFVVAGSVRGRVSIDFDRVTLGQAIDALRSVGIEISPPGAVRIVRADDVAAAVESKRAVGSGEPISLWFKRQPVEELAALLGEYEGQDVYATQSRLGWASVFAYDVPSDALFGAVFASAGLAYRVEGDRIILDRPGTAVRRHQRRLPAWRQPEPKTPLSGLGVAEIELVGRSRSEGEWTAWAYTAGRGLCYAIHAGRMLSDAQVKRVEAEHVLLEMRPSPGSGKPERLPLRLPFPPKDPSAPAAP